MLLDLYQDQWALPRSPLHSLCVCVCVCWGGGGGVEEYNIMIIHYFLRFYVHSFVDLVKRGVLTLVGEIRRCRNDHLLLLLFL